MTEDTYRDKLNSLQLEIEELRAKLKESQTGDTISRRAAIDSIIAAGKIGKLSCCDILRKLPSTQPDIISCKKCIHNHDCEIQYSAQAGDEFYCAFGERRTDE